MCLPMSSRCNGIPECPQIPYDEIDCEACSNMSFKCRSTVNKDCIPAEQRCDGAVDCISGDDEMG